MNKEVPCPRCGAFFPEQGGIPPRYGVASPECWQAFNALLAHERTVWGYPEVHRLIVDAYAVQHPQNPDLQQKLNNPQRLIDASIQSVAIHLIALHFALVDKKDLHQISELMSRVLSNGASFEALDPPADFGALTILDAPLTEDIEIYRAFAWQWAQEAWKAWKWHHDKVYEIIVTRLDSNTRRKRP